MARKTIGAIQADADVRQLLRPGYATSADSLTAAGHVVAVEFATIAAANSYWRDHAYGSAPSPCSIGGCPLPALPVGGATHSIPAGRARLRPRLHARRGRADGEAVGPGDLLRDPSRGRGIRQRRPVPALGAGRGHRRGRRRQPENGRRAADRQPGRHAVAGQGPSDPAGLVPGAGRSAGDRGGARRHGQSVRTSADHLPRES